MSALVVIAELLAERGYGTLAQSIWAGRQPSRTEYPALTVQRYGGGMIETYGDNQQQPYAQVFITAEEDDQLGGQRLADDAWDACAHAGRREHTDEDGRTTAVQTIRPITAVLPLGDDGEGRPMFSFNVEVTYE